MKSHHYYLVHLFFFLICFCWKKWRNEAAHLICLKYNFKFLLLFVLLFKLKTANYRQDGTDRQYRTWRWQLLVLSHTWTKMRVTMCIYCLIHSKCVVAAKWSWGSQWLVIVAITAKHCFFLSCASRTLQLTNLYSQNMIRNLICARLRHSSYLAG